MLAYARLPVRWHVVEDEMDAVARALVGDAVRLAVVDFVHAPDFEMMRTAIDREADPRVGRDRHVDAMAAGKGRVRVVVRVDARPGRHAGHYNKQYSMFPRWRGLLGVNWADGPWAVNYQLRYIGKFSIGSANPAQAFSCDKTFKNVVCGYGAWLQSNVSLGYTIQPINTTVQLGVDNVFDNQPPVMYQNNTINANTDVNTFDTIGRYYWLNATVKF